MKIPEFIQKIMNQVEDKKFEIFIVGGSVRDLLLRIEPKDWDLTTNAKPEEVLNIFPDGKYENNFGTVILPIKDSDNRLEYVVEITTYRSEQGYSDNRRPDEVFFEDRLDKDLERRDFTINALAMKSKDSKIKISSDLLKYQTEISDCVIVDLFGGRKDIKNKIIRAVGEPIERFKEDSLRLMRAIRFSAQLGFEIELKTERAITKMAGGIKFVALERIKDELVKILQSDNYYNAVRKLYETKLLQYILPELINGVGIKQVHHHTNTVFEHNMLSLKYCPSSSWQVRLASLLHDVGKPKSLKIIKGAPTFYNHEYIGAKIVQKIVKRLRFSNNDAQRIVNLVRNHMFYYNVGEVTAHSVRKLIAKTGKENLKDLMDVRIADRLGSGVKKAKPYKLRHLEYMIDKVQNDPVSVKELKINGRDMMKVLKIKPGPKIGQILDILLAEVIEYPENNNKEYLKEKSIELDGLDLVDLRKKAKQMIKKKRVDDDEKIKKEHYVK